MPFFIGFKELACFLKGGCADGLRDPAGVLAVFGLSAAVEAHLQRGAGRFRRISAVDAALTRLRRHSGGQRSGQGHLRGRKEAHFSAVRRNLRAVENKRTAVCFVVFLYGFWFLPSCGCQVGVELITNPKMLFLDEPLSGLDSYAAFTLMEALKNLAATNVPVLCTVHQPSSEIFAMFDDVVASAFASALQAASRATACHGV